MDVIASMVPVGYERTSFVSLGAGTVLQDYNVTVTIGQDTHAVYMGGDMVMYRGTIYQVAKHCKPTNVILGVTE